MKTFAAMGGTDPLIVVVAESAEQAVQKFSSYLHGAYLTKWKASGKNVVEWIVFDCPHCGRQNEGLANTHVRCRSANCRREIRATARVLF